MLYFVSLTFLEEHTLMAFENSADGNNYWVQRGRSNRKMEKIV
jgi:hypothetical protein